ncbi:bifunctional hydroxymethylpyrimidine kinase/phosphomethylpyrimidine kinase [Cochlodiniinecator piscidefendens]|uniref:bifunctional hydroxymethylpyrimidine kinase/phosphomethylpyrimidine kinase n=1 Tax=Cochlodiniinecator piscidefendens TaxID=2715756 RepID=UPI00140C18D0|nr:hydroxymethylpyrimidine/phosphomethylpyrimidine kinase [Cochlodiniinecator piscidefendens]
MGRILVIAGTDSSGGAGLSRDIAVATELGCTVAPVVTAVTVQTNQELRTIHPVPPDIIIAQIKAAFETDELDCIKIGMLGDQATIDAICGVLGSKTPPIVFDPVLKSTSGGVLLSGENLSPLISITSVLTPNLDEAAQLSNRPFSDAPVDIATRAKVILGQGAKSVLIKGGHGGGVNCTDYLFSNGRSHTFSNPRLPQTKRGTGCSVATAIACHLARGAKLKQACGLAIAHVQSWMSSKV